MLEKNVCPAENIPKTSTCIIDGMSIVQKMNGTGKTFTEMAESALSLVLHEGTKSHRIDAFDVYLHKSIKNAE